MYVREDVPLVRPIRLLTLSIPIKVFGGKITLYFTKIFLHKNEKSCQSRNP